MKFFFNSYIIFLILIFTNLLCFGMENINNEFRCNHLNSREQSYTIIDYINETPKQENILCSECAKIELIKRLKKWMNLEKHEYFHCGLLAPKENIEMIHYVPTSKNVEQYKIREKDGSDTNEINLKGQPFVSANELAKYCQIDLGDYHKQANVYVCKYPHCKRYNDLIRIDKGIFSTRNINYGSGSIYWEVRKCENLGHAELAYSVRIN